MTRRRKGRRRVLKNLMVSCGEYFHWMDPDDEWTVGPFATENDAAEYARRFVRAQIEHLRDQCVNAAAIESAYYGFQDYAWHPNVDHQAWVSYCAEHPATIAEQTDYDSLTPAKP